VQIVTNNEQLHAYAANAVLVALRDAGAHECAVKVGGYVLGEFGHLLKEQGVSGAVIFDALHRRFTTASLATRALLLSSYMKLLNMFPELRAQIVQMPSVQQAAVDASGGIDALMHALDLNGDGQVCTEYVDCCL
jgi:AP-2 complex subunit alpha